ncbi:hypothetical protein HHK36_011985 [Tetracentron sinense]|uniref:Uncharacterized protein n=1 Tax=Tetracentron sinense TaxID=13715 RepID=A0A835DKZ4_TETSI|nr:hypothetical protein HHK36_011985 [Tetracentron sinense]
MDPSELRYLEDDDTPMMKTIKGTTTGLVAGTIWGMVVATWNDVPRVERSIALPGLIRTLKMMGNHGTTFAAIGGVYIGVEQLVQNYRMKRDFVNGAVGGFVAGASVIGFKGRSISTALSAGAALAFTSAIIDAGGQTTRIDTGKEYYAYTTEKRPTELASPWGLNPPQNSFARLMIKTLPLGMGSDFTSYEMGLDFPSLEMGLCS